MAADCRVLWKPGSGVTHGHHMVDLDGAAALGSAPEVHVLAGVGFPEVPGRHFAGGPLGEHNAGKVPAKDVVPRVAAVPVDIKPSLAEGLTAVAGVRRPAFHGQAV